jgi:hypothetical protein
MVCGDAMKRRGKLAPVPSFFETVFSEFPNAFGCRRSVRSDALELAPRGRQFLHHREQALTFLNDRVR